MRLFAVGQHYGVLVQVLDDVLQYPPSRLNFVRNILPAQLFGEGAPESAVRQQMIK